jgi:parallel beta-helix repeat protein
MIRRIVAVNLSIMILFASIVILIEIAPTVTAPSTFYVGGTGAGNYSKIQDAINASIDGDTVFVHNGTYYENVVVNKGIELIGEKKETTIIDGNGNRDVVNITYNWVKVSEFTLRSSGQDTMDSGIILRNVLNCIISNNTLYQNRFGIHLYGSDSNTITNNTVYNNYMSILLYLSSNNDVIDNNASFSDYGLYFSYSTDNLVINNTAQWNNESGISIISNSVLNTFEYNSVCHNTRDGFYLWHASYNTFCWNNASYNSEDGLSLMTSHHNNIYNNTVIENDDGLYFWSSSDYNDIQHNHASFNIGDGIIIRNSENNTVYHNHASNNDGYGIYLWNTYNNNFECNTIMNNIRHGIYFRAQAHYNDFKYNLISGNDRGIDFWDSDRNNFTFNNIYFNKDYGIYLYNAENNSFSNNNIISNDRQAYDNTGKNYWNASYPTGGNYWGDYTGVDLKQGEKQDVPGSDEIGDTPYKNINGNSGAWDYYPLMTHIGDIIYLKQGWNLISIPFIQSDTNLSNVLSSIDGFYDAVQYYVGDSSDSWNHYHVSKGSNLNDLDRIDHFMGFWIHIMESEDVPFIYPGSQPNSNQTISLYPGWNMVGYPSLSSYNRTEGLNNLTFDTHVDAIWSYDTASQKWEEMDESDYFQIGKGYYIYVKSQYQWEVPM